MTKNTKAILRKLNGEEIIAKVDTSHTWPQCVLFEGLVFFHSFSQIEGRWLFVQVIPLEAERVDK